MVVTRGLNVICLVKGVERYVWLWIDTDQGAVLNSLGRFAANPKLSFTFYDAAVLSKKIREGATT